LVFARYPFNRIDWMNCPGPLENPAALVGIPYWMLMAAFAILPMALWRRLHRSLRPMADRCRKCGYDLRATPDRCPECGTIPAKVKA
jgi:hypothetical protein